MFADVNGISVYVEVSGPRNGPTLLVISGTGGDLRSDVDRHGNRMTHPAAKAGMRVIRYDQRGLGQTSKPDQKYTMADYADDAAALLRWLVDVDEIDPISAGSAETSGTSALVSVVGISFGGMVAQHLAIRHPAFVGRLVLCCTSSGGVGGSSYDLLALESMSMADRAVIGATISDTRNNPTADPPTYAPGVAGAAARGAIAAQLRAETPDGLIGYRRQLEARADHNTWDALTSITAPTLVCAGVFDGQAPPANSQALTDRIPNATLQMFQGGHGFLFQDPAAWPAILSFLQG